MFFKFRYRSGNNAGNGGRQRQDQKCGTSSNNEHQRNLDSKHNLAAVEQVVMDFTMESLPQPPPVPVLEPHKMEVESMNPSNPENAVVEETASDSNPIPDNIVEAPDLNKGHSAEPDLEAKPKIDLMDAQGPNAIENISD